jgi:hypothetical protein
VINNNGGNAVASNFTINVTGSVVYSSSFPGSEMGTIVTLNPGPYSVDENDHVGYTKTIGTNCSGSIISGQGKTCTITNDDIIPTPSPTPSPTPTPTPTPVTKVIFLPGGGATWNADAILNCKMSNYSGDWTLAPYAEDVYKNILTALSSSNWNTKVFYYDWRTDVRNNSVNLSGYVNNFASTNEKVNLVGHSMGGLVSRGYLELFGGQKVNSFISAGTPYQGSVFAYPVWGGGEIWDDNFVTRIATTILLKHCGKSSVPSIQNLLPTTDYLKNSKTNQMKPVANMIIKNNWLPTNFSSPFSGVRVGTLSGTGFPTLSVIKVIDPTRYDIQLNKWLDGRPVGKEFVDQGDGTVLVSSSQLPGADNQIINQDHSNLVSSTEGMTKILSFLGTAPAQGFRFVKPVLAADVQSQTTYIEPNSMLVVIGYPGNFWITDKNGNVTQDKNGMITISNPTSGDYQVDIVPQSNNTLFIIAQFLPNNKTLYKEYHLSNLQPKTRIIVYNSTRPTEDILREKRDYQKPRILIFLWNLLKKFK